jgi:hypothetical protein
MIERPPAMMNGSAWTAVAIMVATFWSSPSLAEDVQPTLSETLAWMDSTYNPHSHTGGAWGHGVREIHDSNGKPSERRTSTFTYNGCQMTLHAQDDPNAPLFSDLYQSITYNFSLRDIDPNSVIITSLVEFQTRNQEPLIEEDVHTVYSRLTGTEHETRYKEKTFLAAFYIDDDKIYAGRFAKAFRHAIVQCGGKPSAF